MLGVVSTIAHIAVNRSLKLAPASVVMPYQYSQIIWAVVLGFLIFGDWPDLTMLSGSGVIVTAGLSRREPRARKRRCPEARAHRVHRASLRRDCHGRPRLSRKATAAGAGHCETRRQNPRPRAATNRTQSALTFPDAAKRHASLSARSRRTLQQQRSGTRRAHDEAAHENLGRLSIARRRGRLRHNPWISVDGQKTGMEHHRSAAPGSGRSRKEPTRGLIPPGNLSSYV